MSGDKTTWRVAFTRRAEEDILGIFSFIAERDGPDIAETMLGAFIEARDSLRERPDRGRIPPELKRINVLSYREVQVSRYRAAYQVNKTSHEVYMHVVADGRRNFTELLKERLLTASPRGRNS
ncbi:MAG: type II toxin-antitoxin system RelE/ParE family toxin [Desulfovibrionaceae bacterium]